MLNPVHDRIIKESSISRDDALLYSKISGNEIYGLFSLANDLRQKSYANRIDLCSIISAKSGACPEDCSFCAQSAHSSTDINIYPLVDEKKILDAAVSAKKNGARRFCVVTSGKKPASGELDDICRFISIVKSTGLLPCATLGLLDFSQLEQLKESGLDRYHHNLETSEAFFSEICTTHTYKDKVKLIETARSLGLSVCSGGIFGLGESWEDRIDMAFAIKDLGADSVPLNFLTPVLGTPMEKLSVLRPLEALKIIAIYRLILPDREIRVCGGRPAAIRGLQPLIFLSGANGLLIGNYLTTTGRIPEEDLQMISDMGMEI